jgi:hypothetical protein
MHAANRQNACSRVGGTAAALRLLYMHAETVSTHAICVGVYGVHTLDLVFYNIKSWRLRIRAKRVENSVDRLDDRLCRNTQIVSAQYLPSICRVSAQYLPSICPVSARILHSCLASFKLLLSWFCRVFHMCVCAYMNARVCDCVCVSMRVLATRLLDTSIVLARLDRTLQRGIC